MPEPDYTLGRRRTMHRTASSLQQAAETLRAVAPAITGPLRRLAEPVADWLEESANALAWLAPYRSHEGGYGMWETASRVAEVINGTADQEFCELPHRSIEEEVECDRRNATGAPLELELMGFTDAAAMLGVSRQRVAQLADMHPDFPRPLGRLADKPVYTAASIRAFGAGWDRRPGRRLGSGAKKGEK